MNKLCAILPISRGFIRVILITISETNLKLIPTANLNRTAKTIPSVNSSDSLYPMRQISRTCQTYLIHQTNPCYVPTDITKSLLGRIMGDLHVQLPGHLHRSSSATARLKRMYRFPTV